MNKIKPLLKLILIFIVYFIYTTVVSKIMNLLGINNEIAILFVADFIFLIGMIFVYKRDIKEGFNSFKNSHTILNTIFFIIKWVVILFAINIVGGMITEIIFPALTENGNTSAIYSLSDLSTLYIIFKTLIFASVAEVLVFNKTIRELISNNIVFVVTSSLIYALINVMYTDISFLTIIDLTQYFIFSSVLAYLYVRNKDNIFVPMLIKFSYNLIPLTILLIGIGK